MYQHEKETTQAEKAVESAKRVISDLQSCGRPQQQKNHREALAAAKLTLGSAENVKRRNSLLAEFIINEIDDGEWQAFFTTREGWWIVRPWQRLRYRG